MGDFYETFDADAQLVARELEIALTSREMGKGLRHPLAGIPYQSAYCAAKFAVRGFTESLRHELAGTGVRAITIHPGGVKTNIARNARVHADPRGLGRSKDEMAAEFEAITLTTPDKAAAIIHKGVDAGKARILIGADAYLFDALTRITPTHYYGVLDRVMELVARRR